MKRTFRRRTAVQAALMVVASSLALVVTNPGSSAAAPPAGVTVTGQACQPGTGVTVVVDPYQRGDEIQIGCAPGAQTSGLAALKNAGFDYNTLAQLPGVVCDIEGIPSDTPPGCWYPSGWWNYSTSDGTTEYVSSDVGAGGVARPVGSVDGWGWTEPFPPGDGFAPRVAVSELADYVAPIDCTLAPEIPAISIISNAETLPVALSDGGSTEIAVIAPGDDPAAASFAAADSVPLAGRSGQTRVVARRAGTECPNAPLFDFTYDVRAAYAPRWNSTGDGAPSPSVAADDPTLVWATGYENYEPGANVSATYQTPENAPGPVTGSLVVLGDRGRITLTFDTPITNGSGDDFAVFENGFQINEAAGTDFLELGYVEVSSDGTNFVRFDTGSRQTTPVGGFQGQRADLLGGLAGKDLGNRGTPFDLTALSNKAAVRSGQVNLQKITHVRLVDITGDGDDLDSFGRPIYDAHPTMGSAGFDLSGVGVLNEYVAPYCDLTLDGSGGEAAALTWLGCELQHNDGTLPSPYGGTDYGLTLDAVLAYAIDGQTDNADAVTALGKVRADIRKYVTDASFGPGDERWAAPMSKALLAFELMDGDPNADGLNLETELRARLQATGKDAGRFSDLSGYGDNSNGVGQSLAIQALSHTDGGVPQAAVDFLLKQQCPNGGFRGVYAPSGGCTSNASADSDYTAYALAALYSAPQTRVVRDAVDRGANFLVGRQAASGAVNGTDMVAGPNANTTGVAAQTLRSFGRTAEADKAAGWVRSIQLADSPAGRARSVSARAGNASNHLGAIAYNQTKFDAAVLNGIDEAGLDQWRRATAQGLLAFDAKPFGLPGALVEEPTTTSSTTTTTEAGTTPSTGENTTASTAGGSVGENPDQGSLGSGDSGSTGGGVLPRTGTSTSPVLPAMILVVVGASLLIVRRRFNAA